MKLLSTLLFAAAASQQVFAHYRFLNFQGSGDYTYIRKPDNFQSNGPVTSVTGTDVRCGMNAAGKSAETTTVAAGSTVTFKVFNGITHAGPLMWYMAKAPESVNGWDASGNVWFKIAQTGATFSGGAISWPSSGLQSVSTKIPASVPDGEYLIRVEHIGLHSAGSAGGAQLYMSCAQVKVTGGGNGKPAPLVAFPGAYVATDPSLMINIYYPVPKSYTPPGPAVWEG